MGRELRKTIDQKERKTKAYTIEGDKNFLIPQQINNSFRLTKLFYLPKDATEATRTRRFSCLFHQQKTRRDKSTYILIKAN